MAVGDRHDPYSQFNFLVEIDGLSSGGFTEVTGLGVQVEVEEYKEGGVNDFTHTFRGPTKSSSNLILKHGLMDTEMLWNWQQEVIRGIVVRRTVSLALLNLKGEEAKRWTFREAFPIRWNVSDFNAARSEVAIETLELAHKGFHKPGEISLSLGAGGASLSLKAGAGGASLNAKVNVSGAF